MPTTQHPNTVASLISTGLAALLYHFAQRFGWVRFSVDDGILAAGAIIAAVLFVGKRGVWPSILSLKALIVGTPGLPQLGAIDVVRLKALLAELEKPYLPVAAVATAAEPAQPVSQPGPRPLLGTIPAADPPPAA